MSDIAIRVDNLGKKYRRGLPAGHDRLSEMAVNFARGAFGFLRRKRPAATETPRPTGEFWALKDVSFDVKRGDVVGIIGRNGAGKSTLLKVLSRITEPTSGRFGVRGRVASLLEVGTGFHGELTGRENLFLSGTLLGMKRQEIQKKFDEIVAFAELDAFLDTPVKRYSSGMYTRLAFAVAAHLEPEILIVDEVLAVGDAAFQKKCLGKMDEVAKQGRTILFVSHNMQAVTGLCRIAVLLEAGRVVASGPVGEIVTGYGRLTPPALLGENENIRLQAVRADPIAGDRIAVDTGIRLTIEFECLIRAREVDCTVEVTNSEGVIVFHDGTFLSKSERCEEGAYRVTMEVPPHTLNAGEYAIRLIFGQARRTLLFQQDGACRFEVSDIPSHGSMVRLPGVMRPKLVWQIERLGPGIALVRGEV